MSSRGSYGGDDRCGGARPSDQRPEQSSGPVSWPALQTSEGRGAPASGGRGHGNRPPDFFPGVSKEIGRKPQAVDVASFSAASVQFPESDSGELAEQVQSTPVKTTLPPATSTVTQPVQISSSSTSVQFPEFGFRQSRANQFLVQVAERDLYHYDVLISPEVISEKVNRAVMKTLVSTYGESHLGKRTPAYDGRKSLFTAGPLPFESIEFVLDLKDKKVAGSSSSSKERQFKVAIKLASRHVLFQLQQLLERKTREAPYETFQVLDCFLRDLLPSQEYIAIGRSLMDGIGIEYFSSYLQSLRLTQIGFSLNTDVSARSSYEPLLRDFNRPMIDSDRVMEMINGARVASWTCLSFSTSIDRDLAQEFCKQLIGICVTKGMEFNPRPAIPFISCQSQRIEEAVIDIHKRAPGLQLLMVILPDVTGSHRKIKRVCEKKLGIVSQCCQPNDVRKLSKQYMENVALKINVKTGRRNTVLDDAITDSERLIGAAANNQPAVMIEDAWFASVPVPVGMTRRGRRQIRAWRQRQQPQQPTEMQLFDVECSDEQKLDPEFSDDLTPYEMNVTPHNKQFMVKPARSKVLAKVPKEMRNRLRVSKSVPITKVLAKTLLGAKRMKYLGETERADDSLYLSDSNGQMFIYFPTVEPGEEYVGEEMARNLIEESVGPVRDQWNHPLCWDFCLGDLVSSSAVLYGQMTTYKPLSQGYVCQNMDKKLYGSKLTPQSDLTDKKTHSCYMASLYEGLQFAKETGIPLASQEELLEEEWNCNYETVVSSEEKFFKIKEVYRYFELKDALVRLKTHAVGATLICFKGWEEEGIYMGPKENAPHQVTMLSYCDIDGKKAIRCKMSNGDHTANGGYIHVSPAVMLIDAGSARKKSNSFTCWEKPTHLLYDFYSVEMEPGEYGVKLQESDIERENNKQFRLDFPQTDQTGRGRGGRRGRGRGGRRGRGRGPRRTRSGMPGNSSLKVSTQPPAFEVSHLVGGHDENGPSLYYTDPCGTFRPCNEKSIGPGSEGADNSLQEQFNQPPPFEVSHLIAGHDENGLSLYYTDPCGTFRPCNAEAIGPGSEGADSSLQEQFNQDLSLPEAETIAVPILKQLMDDDKVTPNNVDLSLQEAETIDVTILKQLVEDKATPNNVDIAKVAPADHLYTPQEVEAVIASL
ncbi:unnamed protein product [Microthlaspi erraticum]|uniref:Piwi domain-containing protein n=1 Tax=Microthlaspi erraticum TaxID=1685480 RepID=A0A6D2K211_9BRAS|nr:unnamed protein product [Microthlaspi erraticum]